LIPKSFVHSRCGDCKSGVSAGMGSEEAWMWHTRYGHLNFLALRMLAQEDMVRGATGAGTCGSGLQWLPHWQAASHDVSSSSRALCRGTHGAMELVHGDLCGPITPASSSDSHYFLLLVDDCNCFMWLRTLQTKEQAASAIKLFQQVAERERDVTPATSVSHRPRQ
jgi:hypothetical protein